MTRDLLEGHVGKPFEPGRQRLALDLVGVARRAHLHKAAVNIALQGEGFTISQFGQGFASMAAPVKKLKRAILAGHFRHGGNPLLRMCFGNAVAEKDAVVNEKPTKAKAPGRIDGEVASAMAIGRIIAGEVGPSPYESARPDGFVFLWRLRDLQGRAVANTASGLKPREPAVASRGDVAGTAPFGSALIPGS